MTPPLESRARHRHGPVIAIACRVSRGPAPASKGVEAADPVHHCEDRLLASVRQDRQRESGGAGGALRPAQVYGWLDADPCFKQLYAEAHADAMDGIESEAHRRAVDGVDVPVFHGGVQVGAIRRYSDALLALLLKRWRPHVYGHPDEQNGKREPPTSTRAIVVSYIDMNPTKKA